MEEIIREKRQTLIEMSNDKLTVRLSDLINELSKLIGIPASYIDVKIRTQIAYYGRFSKEELMRVRTNHVQDDVCIDDNIMTVDLSGRNFENGIWNQFFKYSGMCLKFEIDDVQADGKTLYEHMGVRRNIHGENGRIYTQFVVDRRIDKLILDIPLDYLVHENALYWYPAELFTQAVLNCVNKSYNSRNQYVRVRARKK